MLKQVIGVAFFAFFLAQCGYETLEYSPSSNAEDQSVENSKSYDDLVVPPKEYYDQLVKEELKVVGKLGLEAAETPILYLDFDGRTLEKGVESGQSFILCSRFATVPASPFSESEQSEIINLVQSFYEDAETAVQVVNEEPSTQPYTTIVVGGNMGDLGCRNDSGVLGIAPFDRGNLNLNDIGFAFTDQAASVRVTAETIAHEAGHSYGLDHIKEREGLMYSSNSANIVGFIVGTTGSGRKQDAPSILQADVGGVEKDLPPPADQPTEEQTPSQEAPTTPPSQTSPDESLPIPNFGGIAQIGDLLGGFDPSAVAGLDFSNVLGNVMNIVPGIGGGLGNLPGGLPDLGGAPIPNLGGIPDLGGIGNIGGFEAILAVIAGGSLGGGLAGLAVPALTEIVAGGGGLPGGLPAFDQVLGLGQFTDVIGLVSSLRTQGAYVNQNFSGADLQAMQSLLKVGYLQAYQGLDF